MSRFLARFLAVLMMLLAATAHAGPCAPLCRPAVAACVAAGNSRASCRRVLRAACRLTFPHVCSYTTSTTTTSTTLPSITSITGTWYFLGAPTSNGCSVIGPWGPVPTYMPLIVVNADGTGGIYTLITDQNDFPLNPAYTTLDATSWTVRSFTIAWNAACVADTRLVAELGNPASAVYTVTVTCDDGSSVCQSVYSGSVRQ